MLGTNVEFWLPESADAPETLEQAREVPLARVRGTAALLVDDEEFVRLSTADMLVELGYKVLERLRPRRV